MRPQAFLLAALFVAAVAASLMLPSVRRLIRSVVPQMWIVQLNGWRLGYTWNHGIRIPMPDGVRLAASLYLPRSDTEKVATIYVRHPYDRMDYGEGLQAAEFFASQGFAVLVEDIRGKFASEGEFIPYRHGTSDGVATLDWIASQPWSNGRVGTWGCSALGELQLVLARSRHPAHVAMIPLGAGGAIGTAAGRYSYFGVFEGGIFQLASGFGWFLPNGATNPTAAPAGRIDVAEALRALPTSDMVQRVRPGPNSYDSFVSKPFGDPFWKTLDYVSAEDALTTPALVINTWGDQTVGDTLAFAESNRRAHPVVARNQRVVIAPGVHCNQEGVGQTGKFGDMDVPGASQPYFDWYLAWFDYWLRDRGKGLAEMAPYTFYMLGEAQWLTSGQWPPEAAAVSRWHLDSGGRANGRDGDGTLREQPPPAGALDEYAYDPMQPVPTRGGAFCCTGDSRDRQGFVDQHDVEQRRDVLIYTSAPLASPLRIAGPLRAHLTVSSSAPDTDFVARLVHVTPEGRATNIQEGALRARYRTGFETPTLMAPGQLVELMVEMRSIAYTIPTGHRLRLQVTSSSFPRLARNLNTGGNNFDESAGVTAVNRVFHGAGRPSYVELHALPSRP